MGKEFEGTDRRRYARVNEEDLLVCEPFDVTALVGAPGQKSHAFTKSLSEGGILFESGTPFSLGSLLKLQIDIPGWEKYKAEFVKSDVPSGRHPFVVLGKVVRVEDVGGGIHDIGVVFLAVDSGHRFALKKYIQRRG